MFSRNTKVHLKRAAWGSFNLLTSSWIIQAKTRMSLLTILILEKKKKKDFHGNEAKKGSSFHNFWLDLIGMGTWLRIYFTELHDSLYFCM